jgi:hypothetical protein
VTVHPPAGQILKWANVDAVALAPGKVVARIGSKFQGNGPYTLTFSRAQIDQLIAATPADELARIDLTIRDHLGRVESLVREMRVTATPYDAVLELDRDQYAPGDPV